MSESGKRKGTEVIYVVLFLQIVILAYLWYLSDELIPLKVESRMTYEYVLGFLARYCAEHQDYGESVFPKTWKIIKEQESENEQH